MSMSALRGVSSELQAQLNKFAKPKFDAYFEVTSATVRAVPDPGGAPWFIYPDKTIVSDLVFLWSVFSDVYQFAGGHRELAAITKSNGVLLAQIEQIVEAEEPTSTFWHFPQGAISGEDALGNNLGDIIRTLRNGFAHSHWLHADMSAVDYWNELGWDVEKADSRFKLLERAKDNYTLYIADAKAQDWTSKSFWEMSDLRIIVTRSSVLRYCLHRYLNYFLNQSITNVFQE